MNNFTKLLENLIDEATLPPEVKSLVNSIKKAAGAGNFSMKKYDDAKTVMIRIAKKSIYNKAIKAYKALEDDELSVKVGKSDKQVDANFDNGWTVETQFTSAPL